MADDWYSLWLKIPAGARPPDHYALLGLPKSCADREQIEAASLWRFEQLDRHALHPDLTKREACHRLMNEVAQAKTTLIDPGKRKAYDHQLARVLRTPNVKPAAPAAAPKAVAAAPKKGATPEPSPKAFPIDTAPGPAGAELESLAGAAPSTRHLAPRSAAGPWIALILLAMGAAVFLGYALHARKSAVGLAPTPQPRNAPAEDASKTPAAANKSAPTDLPATQPKPPDAMHAVGTAGTERLVPASQPTNGSPAEVAAGNNVFQPDNTRTSPPVQPATTSTAVAIPPVPLYPKPSVPAVPASLPAPAADPAKSVAAVSPAKVMTVTPLRRRVVSRDDQPSDGPEKVDKAITAAIAALRRLQKNGNWEQVPFPDAAGGPSTVTGGQFGGLTAIATYALLVAGEDQLKEPLLSAIKWLKTADIKGTYALGFRAQVWPLLDPKTNDLKTLVRQDAEALAALTKTKGAAMGFFDYLPSGPMGRYDHSVSQYGVFGLAACARSGEVDIPLRFWNVVEEAWIRDQGPTGGWAYEEGRNAEAKASMTAGGVATLLTTQEFSHAAEGVACTGNPKTPHLDTGLKWLGDHFNLVLDNYTWYGIQRIGVDGGYKYFGTTDWFKAGAAKLVRTQSQDGTWSGVPNTAFALLFLARGREPVAINKLEYSSGVATAKGPANWNQRPRDVANVSRWLGKQNSRFYNWQTIDLTAASDDVHDAPILYVAGNRALNLTKGEEGKLREYLDDGGLAVFNADCGAAARPFVDSIMGPKGLSKQLGYDYEWRKLPDDHPIYTEQSFRRSSWKGANTQEVYGLSNGSRELMILFASNDPARFWQTQTIAGREWAHELMADIFYYATDKTPLPFKGPAQVVRPRPEIKADKSINIARLEYQGNWDPEPGGWRRLAAILHNEYRLDVNLKTVKLADGTLADGGYKLAHLTGTGKVHLSDAEKNALKVYLTVGGTLVVDACGGSPEFSESMLTELGVVLGKDAEQLKQPIQFDNPLLTTPGGLVEETAYRNAAKKRLGNTALHAPRLRVALHNQRPVCYFSPEDLSVGLLGKEVDGIYGYTPAASTAIMRTILLSVEATP